MFSNMIEPKTLEPRCGKGQWCITSSSSGRAITNRQKPSRVPCIAELEQKIVSLESAHESAIEDFRDFRT